MYSSTLLSQIKSLDFSKDVLTNLLNFIENKPSDVIILYSQYSTDMYEFRNNIYSDIVNDLAFLEYGYVIDSLHNTLYKFVDMTSGDYVIKKTQTSDVVKLLPITFEFTGNSNDLITEIIRHVMKYIIIHSQEINICSDPIDNIKQILSHRISNGLRNDYIILDPSALNLNKIIFSQEYISVYEKKLFNIETYCTAMLPRSAIIGEFPADVKNFIKLNINTLTKNNKGKLYCNYSLYKVDSSNLTNHYITFK